MEFDWIDQIGNMSFPIFRLASGVLAAIICVWFVRISLRAAIKKTQSSLLIALKKHGAKAFNLFVPLLFIFIALRSGEPLADAWYVVSKVLLILSSSFLLIKSISVAEEIILEQYDLNTEDNRDARKIITQLVFIKKAAIVMIVLMTLGVLLLSFEAGRKYGAGLLTSAGVASIIIGFAAQKSIANFLAGIQIAFTQPIKIDDAVLVENEWGWIEEINLTYVVVRLWDWRRLVLPITYFIEKPFQNWTRNKGELIGAVYWHLDYRAPIEKIREKLTEIVQADPLWDGQVIALQVVETQEFTIKVRGLMSAKTSPTAFDLRCHAREQIITFLQKEYPESLPTHRFIMENKNEKLNASQK